MDIAAEVYLASSWYRGMEYLTPGSNEFPLVIDTFAIWSLSLISVHELQTPMVGVLGHVQFPVAHGLSG